MDLDGPTKVGPLRPRWTAPTALDRSDRVGPLRPRWTAPAALGRSGRVGPLRPRWTAPRRCAHAPHVSARRGGQPRRAAYTAVHRGSSPAPARRPRRGRFGRDGDVLSAQRRALAVARVTASRTDCGRSSSWAALRVSRGRPRWPAFFTSGNTRMLLRPLRLQAPRSDRQRLSATPMATATPRLMCRVMCCCGWPSTSPATCGCRAAGTNPA